MIQPGIVTRAGAAALAKDSDRLGRVESDVANLPPDADDRPWLKLTGTAGGLFAWTEQTRRKNGTFYDKPDGRAGKVAGVGGETKTWNPAEEINGGSVPRFPWYARADRAINTDSDAVNVGVKYTFAAGGGDSCLLAVLTAKDYSGPFITYSYALVSDAYAPIDPDDPASPLSIIYTKTGTTGGPGSTPAYHEQKDVDLVVSTDSTHLPAPGADCVCVRQVTARADNGDGTFTWTFGAAKCVRTGTLDPATGAATDCAAVTPCAGATLTARAAAGTYPDVGRWHEFSTVCRQPAQEAPPQCVVRICKGSGDWYFIPDEPRWEFVAFAGAPDATGVAPGILVRIVQGSLVVVGLAACEIVEVNALVGP